MPRTRDAAAEDAAIEAAISADPDTAAFTEADFARARRSADIPELAAFLARRQAVETMDVDRAVVERLRAEGPDWEQRANALLRKAVGLD